MPIMDHGEIVAGEISPQTLADGTPANHLLAGCGAMLQQRDGHGLQSWPQQFIRLVGSHRRPAPVRSAPAGT